MRFSQRNSDYIIYECHYPSGYCISTVYSIYLNEPYEFLFFDYLSEDPTQTYSFAPSASFGEVNKELYNYFDENQESQSFLYNDKTSKIYAKLRTPGIRPTEVFYNVDRYSKKENNYTSLHCEFRENNNSYIECDIPNNVTLNEVYSLYYKEICSQFYETKKQFSVQDNMIESITYTDNRTCGNAYGNLILTLTSPPNEKSSDKIRFTLLSEDVELSYYCNKFEDKSAKCRNLIHSPKNNSLTYKKGSLKSKSEKDAGLGDLSYSAPLILDRTLSIRTDYYNIEEEGTEIIIDLDEYKGDVQFYYRKKHSFSLTPFPFVPFKNCTIEHSTKKAICVPHRSEMYVDGIFSFYEIYYKGICEYLIDTHLTIDYQYYADFSNDIIINKYSFENGSKCTLSQRPIIKMTLSKEPLNQNAVLKLMYDPPEGKVYTFICNFINVTALCELEEGEVFPDGTMYYMQMISGKGEEEDVFIHEKIMSIGLTKTYENVKIGTNQIKEQSIDNENKTFYIELENEESTLPIFLFKFKVLDDEMEIELRCSKKEKKAECVKHKQMLEGETYVIYYYGSCNDIYDTGVTVNYKSKKNEESSDENENNQNNKTEEITIDDNNKNDESESNNHMNYISINLYIVLFLLGFIFI